MTGLLASVRTVDEAMLALRGGVDIVDCKDPGRGALGTLPVATVAAIVDAVSGARPVSAAVDDVVRAGDGAYRLVEEMAGTGVEFVKVALWPHCAAHLAEALSPLCRRYRLIAVLSADSDGTHSLVPALAAAGFAGVMLDTVDKTAGTLLDHLDVGALAAFIAQARGHGLVCGLAGSLSAEQIETLLPLGADYLGFRGALCGGGRASAVSAEALARVRRRMPSSTSSPRPLPPELSRAAL